MHVRANPLVVRTSFGRGFSIGSGRGAAWLARLLGVQEVPGSNPGGPTNLPYKYSFRGFVRVDQAAPRGFT